MIAKHPAAVRPRGLPHRRAAILRCPRIILARSTVQIDIPGEFGDNLSAQVAVCAGTKLVQVSLKKPLGIIFADKAGKIVVDELVPGGHAAASGNVQLGDELRLTTARIQGAPNATGKQILFSAQGETFDTVIAAIQSNTCSQCPITLVLERPNDS